MNFYQQQQQQRQQENIVAAQASDVSSPNEMGFDVELHITSMPGRHAPGLLHYLHILPPVMGSLLDFVIVNFNNQHQPISQQQQFLSSEIPASSVLPPPPPPPAFSTSTNGNFTVSQRDAGILFRIYISGDTLVHKDLNEIPRRFRGIDLCLLHLGGTAILGGSVVVTMDAMQGIQAIRIVNPRKAIPIHYDDYDVFKSPLSDFKKAVLDAGLQSIVEYLDRGDTYLFLAPSQRFASSSSSSSSSSSQDQYQRQQALDARKKPHTLSIQELEEEEGGEGGGEEESVTA